MIIDYIDIATELINKVNSGVILHPKNKKMLNKLMEWNEVDIIINPSKWEA